MIGLFIARRDNGSWITDGKARIGLCITCIAACKDLIAAGSWEVIWRSVDGVTDLERGRQQPGHPLYSLAVPSNGEPWKTRLESIDWHHIPAQLESVTAVVYGDQTIHSGHGSFCFAKEFL